MKEFFDTIRPIFEGGLNQSQVDGINRILEAFYKYGDRNINTLAYSLATSWWETGQRMQPVKETTNAKDKTQPSDATVIRRLDSAFKAGKLKWVKKPYWKDGWFGRGDVQLTHEFNYQGKVRAAVLKEFMVDIHENPDLVLRPDISAFILIKGITEGWFTGKKTGTFIDTLDESDEKDYAEYLAARATVNGKDRAKEIATAALVFEHGIRAVPAVADVDLEPTPPEPAPVPKTPSAPAPMPTAAGIQWGWAILALVIALGLVVVAVFAYRP